MTAIRITHEIFSTYFAKWGYRRVCGQKNYRLYHNHAWHGTRWITKPNTNEPQFIYLEVSKKPGYFTVFFSISVSKYSAEEFKSEFDPEFVPENLLKNYPKDKYWKKLISNLEPTRYSENEEVSEEDLSQYFLELKQKLEEIRLSV